MESAEKKHIGCLLGAAIGDALGMPWIGRKREEIPPDGGREFAGSTDASTLFIPVGELGLGYTEIVDTLGPGQWTGDTQLLLALAETLIEEGGVLVPEAWAHKLAQWVHAGPRTPGLSTLQAALDLRSGEVLWDEAADPEGAGCGPAARTAPIGLLYADTPHRRRDAAVLQAQVTHGHPDAQAAALAVSEAVALCLPVEPRSLSNWDGAVFLNRLAEVVRTTSPQFAEFGRCLELARTLLIDDVEASVATRVLGVTGWSREAVPCALYCVARYPTDFEEAVAAAVNLTGGATASIAAIAGAVAGTLHGVEGIPARWRAGVEEAAGIVETALALAALPATPASPAATST